MTKGAYEGPERRKFERLGHVTPLAYKVCKPEVIAKLLEGYTSNVSSAGLFCNIKDRVHKGDILWLSFDRSTLIVCEELEKRSFIYQSGVIGNVVRVQEKSDGTYDVGVNFITREVRDSSNIYPRIHFLMMKGKGLSHIEEPVEESE